ncbi:MAG TPA: glycosyltransferase family 4 protein [Methylomirabilota bacterium]|nr:glycosyltransferase family 4 protein [Methylomirabilota bacterium]
MGRAVVLIAGKDPLEERGGHSTYVRAHARAAMRAGFEPHLFCASRENGEVQTDYGVVHRVPSPQRFLRQQPGSGFRTYTAVWNGPLITRAAVRFLASRPGPHLVHGFGVWSAAAVAIARRLQPRDVPAVAMVSAYTLLEHEARARFRGYRKVHGLGPRLSTAFELAWMRGLIYRRERWAYRRARLVAINYDSVRRLLETACGAGIPFRRMAYASEAAFLHEGRNGPGIAPDAVAALAPADAPLIVSVSRHDPRKGVDVLLGTLARLRGAGVPFRACLVGGGRLLAAHRELARRLGLAGSVTVTGIVPDPYAYLQCADVFVLPSLEEGSGSLSLLEALQAGVAVVASGVDGIPEDVTEGRSALLVPPNDEEALAGALRRLLGDVALRDRLAREARATFEARFSAPAFSAGLAAVYAELGFTP